MSELPVSELLSALVGALAAYLLDIRKSGQDRLAAMKDEQKDRRRARAALATALLLDLRTLESTLRQYYRRTSPVRGWGILPSPLFDRVEHEIVMFSPGTVGHVMNFYTSYRDFTSALDLAKAGAEPPMTDEKLDWSVRAKSAFALHALPAAVQELAQEGGQMPEPKHIAPVVEPNLPPLPDRIFPRTVAPTTTLDSDRFD